MRKLLTAALLGTSLALAGCGDNYADEEADDTAGTADTGYTEPTPAPTDTPTPTPTGTDTPEPTDTPTPEPADAY